jgi:methylenetetrahydrofolate reductase (NADPH)
MLSMPCTFGALERPPTGTWAPGVVATPVRPPLVLTDLSVPPADAVTLTATARTLAGGCDALLVGDHQDRPDFPPTVLARLIADAGGQPWVTLACRDRNRVVLEQELHGLHLDGLATVLCVTGDGRAFDVRPDVSQVFDLDGTRLAALAASIGLPVGVVETPTAPPVHLRPGRLVEKQRAGAQVVVLNHVRSPSDVDVFLQRARRAGLTMPVIASVSVYTDERSAAVLQALPGLEIEPETVRRVLAAADPVAAGIASAVAEARQLLSVDGVVGVNLSGLASARGPAYAAAVQAEIGQRIRSGAADPQEGTP